MSDSSVDSVNLSITATRGKSVNKQIFRALLSIASAVMLIRVFGMLNQIVVTDRFGANAAMDAYFVAYAMPYLIAQLLINSIEYSVIPVYSQVRQRKSKEQTSVLFSTLLNLLLLSMGLLTVLMFIFRREVIFLSAPTLDATRVGLSLALTPFIFPILLLMVVVGYLESILNAEGQFGWPAYAGMLVPLTTAAFVLIAGKSYGVVMLCIGMVVGLALQLCVFILRAKRAKLVYRFTLNLREAEVGMIILAAGPAFLGGLISQASPLIDTIFAASLTAGSISALNYSLKIVGVVSAVIFGATARALLPHFSRQASGEDLSGFKDTFRLYTWAVVISTGLMAVIVIVFAHPLVRILFQRGAFTAEDTHRTAITMIGFAIGLAPMAFGFVASRALSALRKNRLLIYVTVFSVFANALFDYIFARFWQSEGIALATSAVYFCTMFILLFMLRRVFGKMYLFTPPQEIKSFFSEKITDRHLPGWESLSTFALSYNLPGKIIRMGVILSVFAIGVVGILLNSYYSLRIALGSVVILALMRYRLALLLAWVSVLILVGFNASLAGNNLLTGLVAPTLLLMTCMPVRQTFRRMPALACLFIYLLWVFTTIGFSPIGVGAFLTHWTIFMAYVGIGVLTINIITTRRRLMWLIDTMLFMATLVALYGIYGYIFKKNGIPSGDVGFRIISIFQSSPSLALYLSLVIPLAFFRALTLQGMRRIGYLLVFLVLFIALILTFTRSAFISVPLSIFVMILMLPSKRMRKGLLTAVFGVAILIVMMGTKGNIPIFSRFFGTDLTSLNGRVYLWQALLDHFDPSKLLGQGLDASDVLLTNLQVSAGNHGVIATAPHSLFLGTLYDHGIIGATLLSIMFLVLFVSLVLRMREANGLHRMLFATALAVFINVFVQSLTSSDFWIEDFSIYFWVIMSLPFALCWYTSKHPSQIDEEAFDDEATEQRMRAVRRIEREAVSLV